MNRTSTTSERRLHERRAHNRRQRKARQEQADGQTGALRSRFWHPQRGWHVPFAMKVGLAIGLMSMLGAILLASLSVRQHSSLLQRQNDAFGQTIVEQLAGSLVEPVFTDDLLGIQLQLNQLVARQMVHGAAVFFPNGQLMAQAGVVDVLFEGGSSAIDPHVSSTVGPDAAAQPRQSAIVASGMATTVGRQLEQLTSNDSARRDGLSSSAANGALEVVLGSGGVGPSAASSAGASLEQSLSTTTDSEHATPFAALNLPVGHFQSPVKFSGANGAYAVVSLNRSPLTLVFATSTRNLFFALLVISIVSVIGAYIVSRWLARPVRRLLSMTKDAREGRVVGLDNDNWRDEWADISAVYAQLGDEVNKKRSAEKLLQRFVDIDVADELLSGGDILKLERESVEATVLFVDLVEFTRISESMRPTDVATLLNRYLSIFASCARIYRGTVDKFIGDAAMIVFGAPRPDAQHRLRALQCATAIQEVAVLLNEKRAAIGLAPINLRIGVNAGKMHAGILGSEYRMEYTVVGDAVNVASRLCDIAEPGEVLMSETVYDAAQFPQCVVSDAGTIAVKGREQSLRVYRLDSLHEQRSLMVSNLIDDLLSA